MRWLSRRHGDAAGWGSTRSRWCRSKCRGNGHGVEAAAREVRYRALARFAREEAYDVVLTAHHEDDRIETFLMQWMRGAGPEGLAAFPQTRELVIPGLSASRNAPPLLLVRPWSGVLRADIDRYARSVKLSYVEDESNRSPKYLRNRIRREVVPLLDKIRPGLQAGRGARRFRSRPRRPRCSAPFRSTILRGAGTRRIRTPCAFPRFSG